MAANDEQVLLRKLKKQVKLLQQREEKSRAKLRCAMKKMRQMAKSFKSGLVNMRVIKVKDSADTTSAYAKIAHQLEQQMLKNMAAREKALSDAMFKLERKNIAGWKRIAKLGKRTKLQAPTTAPLKSKRGKSTKK